MSAQENRKIIQLSQKPAKDHWDKKQAKNPDTIPFPIEALPQGLNWLISSLYESNRFNKEFQAGAAIAVFSAICGNHYKVKVK